MTAAASRPGPAPAEGAGLRIAVVLPGTDAYSETFIRAHVDRLPGEVEHHDRELAAHAFMLQPILTWFDGDSHAVDNSMPRCICGTARS